MKDVFAMIATLIAIAFFAIMEFGNGIIINSLICVLLYYIISKFIEKRNGIKMKGIIKDIIIGIIFLIALWSEFFLGIKCVLIPVMILLYYISPKIKEY